MRRTDWTKCPSCEASGYEGFPQCSQCGAPAGCFDIRSTIILTELLIARAFLMDGTAWAASPARSSVPQADLSALFCIDP